MRLAYEAIGIWAEQPGTFGKDGQPADGQSFRVRTSSKAEIVALTGHRITQGTVTITSPLLHDNVLAIQDSYDDTSQRTRLFTPGQPLRSQDDLRVTMTGSSIAGNYEQNVMYLKYQDVPGIDGQFLSLSELMSQGVEYLTQRVQVSLVAGSSWSTDIPIDTDEDQMKANSRYAVLGWSVRDSRRFVLRMISPDWGNLGVATPHNYVSGNYIGSTFLKLAEMYKSIPVFNSANKSLCTVSAFSQEDVTVQVYINYLRLK